MTEILLWAGYFAVFAFLVHKGRSKDAVLSGSVGFGVQAFAYVATYISAVALVGFGGLAHAYGLQMLLVAAGNVWFGTWAVYRFLAWPTRKWQERLGARTPAQLLGLGHGSPSLTRAMAFVFALFLGVYGSAVIKGAALLLAEILPVPVWALIWLVAILVGLTVFIGGLRGVLYTEAMQGVVMLVGMLMLVWAIFSKVGGPWEGMQALAALPPSDLANNGFVSLSGGERGLFILSLVVVTSIAVWAQPQMMQRHFAIADPRQLKKTTPLAMFILTVLVGGAYFAAALSRLILPEVASPDQVMPKLVQTLLPEFALHIFVLAIVSASLSTATGIYHIAVSALSEDLRGRPSNRLSWFAGIAICVLVSGGCAQIKGQLVALLCTTSWSIVGAMALVPYVALVRFGRRNAGAAWASAACGFFSCLVWYLIAYGPTSIWGPQFGSVAAGIPPFFVGFLFSWIGWAAASALSESPALEQEAGNLRRPPRRLRPPPRRAISEALPAEKDFPAHFQTFRGASVQSFAGGNAHYGRTALMSQPEINIRILDLNGTRMAQAERELRRHLKQHGIEARITCVGCGLEIARQGFTNATPALLMNQYTITEGKEITEEAIETFCKQLLIWIERQQDAGSR
ncbi:sodium:solute symporter family protein [uncultured Bilophila sp.]|uniref:sodium:solute symporter family protein n=1 Tax=uncultured Bilophila sp. TaxID=529385 RepID=UPI00280BA735|nr:sodium:solute symporter family protein [uncultured Bilophila sp.]